MISTQFTIKLFAAFAIGQVVSAAPSSSIRDIASRGNEVAATNQSLGLDGQAHIAALEESVPIAFSEENKAGMNAWLPILLGFHKCNKNWAKSMLELSYTPSEDQVTVKPYVSKDKKRESKVVKLDNIEETKKLLPDFKADQSKPWWQWALLEAILPGGSMDGRLDMAQSIQALSGVEAVILERAQLEEKFKDEEQRKALFAEVFTKIEFSPVWLQWEENGNYSVALKTFESSSGAPGSSAAQSPNMTSFRFPVKEDEDLKKEEDHADLEVPKLVVTNFNLQNFQSPPERIVHLKDFPKFDETTGEWVKSQ